MLGYDDEEEERQRLAALLGGGGGITPNVGQSGPLSVDEFDVDAPPPQQSFDLQAPEMPALQSQGGIPGYTPPPAAKGPQYMEHVADRGFNPGDVATLGAILASLALGKPEVTAGMAGQYGMNYSQQVAKRDQQNREIDMYNAELSQRDPELERWKLDQRAQQEYGNLSARREGLDLERAREKRIAEAAAAEADPNSTANQGRVKLAQQIAEARSKVSLDEARGRSEIELAEEDKLAQLLQRGKYAAPKAAAGGGGGKGTSGPKAAKPLTPEQQLKQKLAENALKGIESGTVDPLTGKLKDPEATESAGALVPFDDTHVANAALFRKSAGNHANYQKLRQQDADLAGGAGAFDEMVNLLTKYGSESDLTEEGAEHRGSFDVSRGRAQKAWAVLKNLGVVQPSEAKVIDEALGADMSPGARDALRLFTGDERAGRLRGAGKAFRQGLTEQRKKMGLGDGPGSTGKAQAGFAEAPSDRGTRTVTVTYTDGETEQVDTDAAGIARLKAHPDVRSVQ